MSESKNIFFNATFVYLRQITQRWKHADEHRTEKERPVTSVQDVHCGLQGSDKRCARYSNPNSPGAQCPTTVLIDWLRCFP